MFTTNLIRSANSIITRQPYPAGVKKFGKAHRSLIRQYGRLLGETPDAKKSFELCNFMEKEDAYLMKLRKLNLWAGANISFNPGKHKIPRFLYHITTPEGYNGMKQNGYLKLSEIPNGKGVYMFELQNMIKRYTDFWGHHNLQALLSQVLVNGSDRVILLRIPTSKLDAGKLAIRPQYGFTPLEGDEKILTAIGDSALSSKLYKQRKTALEYIYPREIDIRDISLVGKAKIPDVDDCTPEDALKIWKNLTKDTPENKAFTNFTGDLTEKKDFFPNFFKKKPAEIKPDENTTENFFI